MREHFDRLIDRINAHEVSALAQGDGFSEAPYEPASIDEILTIATFPKPDAEASTEEAVKADLAATEHDVPIPQNAKVLAAVELLERAASRLHSGEPIARLEVPADDSGCVPRRRHAPRPRVHPDD